MHFTLADGNESSSSFNMFSVLIMAGWLVGWFDRFQSVAGLCKCLASALAWMTFLMPTIIQRELIFIFCGSNPRKLGFGTSCIIAENP